MIIAPGPEFRPLLYLLVAIIVNSALGLILLVQSIVDGGLLTVPFMITSTIVTWRACRVLGLRNRYILFPMALAFLTFPMIVAVERGKLPF